MVSQRSKGQRDRRLTLKQQRFIKAYAKHGNGTKAARQAGYAGSDETLAVCAYDNLRKPQLIAAAQQEIALLERIEDYGAGRVKRRLDALSHGAEQAEQYGVAVRAEELIGRAAGMFVDQSITLRGDLSAAHLDALVEVAKSRQLQPVDLGTIESRKKLLDE